MENEDVIVLNHVTKKYKMGGETIRALDEVNLSFKQGKIYCLLGVSGSGKSTLLNVMAGLEKPTSGEVIFNGHHVEKMNEKRLALFRQKFIGFIFQQYNLLPTFTALENVTLPLIFKGVDRKTRNKKARDLLIAVGLDKRMNHKPSEMSGGQQQRVSIARAYVNKPSVVFADEPTGNLDETTTIEMMHLIIKMAEENNQTLVIVTHNLELAKYADEVIHLRDGKVEWLEENIRETITDEDVFKMKEAQAKSEEEDVKARELRKEEKEQHI